jgi:hypothetical protein
LAADRLAGAAFAAGFRAVFPAVFFFAFLAGAFALRADVFLVAFFFALLFTVLREAFLLAVAALAGFPALFFFFLAAMSFTPWLVSGGRNLTRLRGNGRDCSSFRQ